MSNPLNEAPVPLAQFGRDHWSTFAYLETRVVDRGGAPELARMRCDPIRHPRLAHPVPETTFPYHQDRVERAEREGRGLCEVDCHECGVSALSRARCGNLPKTHRVAIKKLLG